MKYVFNVKEQIITMNPDSKSASSTSVLDYVFYTYLLDVSAYKSDINIAARLSRTIPIQSEPYLIEWLNNHPTGKTENLEAFTVNLLEQAWSSHTND